MDFSFLKRLENSKLPRNKKACWFRQKASAILLADMDGLRSSLSLKGSAGMKPCLHCLNCVKKHSGLEGEAYIDITEHDHSKFIRATDQDIWDLADALQSRVARGDTKHTINLFEMSSGLNYFEEAIFFRPCLRTLLLPSNVCVDAMHCYYANGVASWEIALCLRSIQQHTYWTVNFLQQACLQSKWTGPKCSKHVYTSYQKGLFSEKLFTDFIYKGQASQVESLLPLLHYYFEGSLARVENIAPMLRSFAALIACHDELRKLRYQWAPVVEADVLPLTQFQSAHHKLFVECYGADLVKPKHHHRIHLPKAFVLMQLALRCETHESKHRNYKHGLAERMTSLVHDGFQESILPRLLLSQAKRVRDDGLKSVNVLEPKKDAPLPLKVLMMDPGLQTAKALSYFNSTVYPGDILCFADGSAGKLELVLVGAQISFHLRVMTLEQAHASHKVWRVHDSTTIKDAFEQSWHLPPWWRYDPNRPDIVTCLL